jgi:amino-acid N-acetyltransferase
LVGCAVIERYGTDALLRSVAVSLDCRGTGLGRGLVEAAEHEAKHLPARRLYLLTETADSFFASLGYRPIDRDLVPGEVRGSAQFSVLCPVSAVVMVREIGLNLFADSPSSAE